MRLEAGLLRYDCDEDNMLFNEVPEEKIHGVEEFDTCVAIVLYSCILFFDKNSTKVSMHIKMPHITLMERISKFLHLGYGHPLIAHPIASRGRRNLQGRAHPR